jgi:chlorobactene glucosyltransferase
VLFQSIELIHTAPWLLPFLTLPRLARRTPNLSDAPRASGRLVSVIIPARNEATTIERVVRSIQTSTYHPLELLVVDDRSTDNTARRVERIQDDRVRLVRGADLPEGWYGKPWACYQGYQEARGELLLFTDADTYHQPELLERAVGALLTQGVDLVTVSPVQRCVTFWERIVMPQIWFLLALRYTPASVNRATRGRDVIANGQFILTTRSAYEAAGTHRAVRHEVAEDLALAQAYLGAGRKLHFSHAERLMETRMYQGLAHMVEGWSKNVYLGGRRSFPDEPIQRAMVPVILVIALVFWLVPPAVLLGALVTSGLAHYSGAAFAAIAYSAVFWILICYGMRIPGVYGLGYPLGALVALYIVLRSTWRGERKVEWRGRVYGRGQREGGKAGRREGGKKLTG